MSISGNLATMGLEEILQWISQGRKSGTLVLLDGAEERRLVFARGALIGVEPNANDDRLGPEADALRTIQATAERVIAELLRRPIGDFQFLDDGRPADLPPGISIEATRLLILSANRVDEPKAERRENRPGSEPPGDWSPSPNPTPQIAGSPAVESLAIESSAIESLATPDPATLSHLAATIESSRSDSVHQPPKRSFAVLAIGLTAAVGALVALAPGRRQEVTRAATAAGMATQAQAFADLSPDEPRTVSTLQGQDNSPAAGLISEAPSEEPSLAAWDEIADTDLLANGKSATDPWSSEAESTAAMPAPATATSTAEVPDREAAPPISAARSPEESVREEIATAATTDRTQTLRDEAYGPEEAGYQIAPAGQGFEIAAVALDAFGSLARPAAVPSAIPPADIESRPVASDPLAHEGRIEEYEGARGEDVILEPGPGVTHPVLLENTVPAYPPSAPPTRDRTLVDVQVLVGLDGTPESVLLASEPVGSGFDDAAMSAARLTRWQPALAAPGTSARMWVTVRYRFAARPETVYDGP